MALALGSLLMAASFAIAKLNGYLVANVLLSVGGTFIFVPSFQLANAFPKHSGIIVAMVTGAFDASAAVFLIYRLVYESTHGSFSLHTFFFSYATVPTLIILAEFAYMPRHSYHTITELERKIDEAKTITVTSTYRTRMCTTGGNWQGFKTLARIGAGPC